MAGAGSRLGPVVALGGIAAAELNVRGVGGGGGRGGSPKKASDRPSRTSTHTQPRTQPPHAPYTPLCPFRALFASQAHTKCVPALPQFG